MLFPTSALEQARASAKAETDALKARVKKQTDDSEYTESKKPPKARKPKAKAILKSPVALVATLPVPSPSSRPAWMNTHVMDPHHPLESGFVSGRVLDDPAALIAEVIFERMRLRAPDGVLEHRLEPIKHRPGYRGNNDEGSFADSMCADTALEQAIDHRPSAQYNSLPGWENMRALRAIVPNRTKRELVMAHVTKLMKLTREACLSSDGLIEEINEHMPWDDLQAAVEHSHVDVEDHVPTLDVDQMLRVFEKLSHDERCEFLTCAEKVRPLHPTFF